MRIGGCCGLAIESVGTLTVRYACFPGVPAGDYGQPVRRDDDVGQNADICVSLAFEFKIQMRLYLHGDRWVQAPTGCGSCSTLSVTVGYQLYRMIVIAAACLEKSVLTVEAGAAHSWRSHFLLTFWHLQPLYRCRELRERVAWAILVRIEFMKSLLSAREMALLHIQ